MADCSIDREYKFNAEETKKFFKESNRKLTRKEKKQIKEYFSKNRGEVDIKW